MSAPETDSDKLAKDAAETARFLLEDAAKGVAALLELLPPPQVEVMGKHPLLVVGFALIAILDNRASEHARLMESQLEVLQEIAEGVDMLCACTCAEAESEALGHDGGPTPFEALYGQRPEQLYDALKAEYLRLHPDWSVEQHTAAMEPFAKLVGL